jgi:hypothetical protein
MAEDGYECLICGESFQAEDELREHEGKDHHAEPGDDKIGALGCLLAIPVLLWEFKGTLFGLFIVVSVILGVLGVFDKDEAPESRRCLGYSWVRDMESAGQIDEFLAVEPEDGWACEYSLDDEAASLRFRQGQKELEVEIEGRGSSDAYDAAVAEAESRGFSGR